MRRPARQAGVEARIVNEYAGRLLIGEGAAFVLMPVLCGIPKCGNIATLIDPFAPFHMEQNRCSRHDATPRERSAA